MPIYDYQCSSCKHEFTEKHSIDDRYLPEQSNCPSCGETGTISKVILSAPGIAPPDWTKGIDGDFKQTMKMVKRASGKKNTIPDY